GVAAAKIVTIRNAIGDDVFLDPTAEDRAEMLGWFAQPPRWLVGSAGRFSPEKGFAVFIEAAALIAQRRPDAGFVLFGDGPLRGELERLIGARRLQGRVVIAGFRGDL